jgi:hypothetical protein
MASLQSEEDDGTYIRVKYILRMRCTIKNAGVRAPRRQGVGRKITGRASTIIFPAPRNLNASKDSRTYDSKTHHSRAV